MATSIFADISILILSETSLACSTIHLSISSFSYPFGSLKYFVSLNHITTKTSLKVSRKYLRKWWVV
jgi:hypothetical protein